MRANVGMVEREFGWGGGDGGGAGEVGGRGVELSW